MDHISITQPLPPPWPDILAVRPLPAIPSHVGSMFLWGDARVHQVALRTAAHALAQGLHVTVVDTGMAFQVMPIVAMGRACRIVPEVFLRRVHLVRAFTCWQLTTLLCDRLQPLLTAHPMELVILLEPLSAFFDEDVTAKEARLLFSWVLQTVANFPQAGPRLLMAQPVPAYHTPRRVFARDLLRVVDVGLRLMPGEGRWSVEVVKPRPSIPILPDYPP